MGSKTTYYSLAKDKLKGKHPRIYNLILIFTLFSLTGTAAFLISDILSFGVDYDNGGIQSSEDMSGLDKGSFFSSPLKDDGASREAAKDAAQEKEPTLSVLVANSSPNGKTSIQKSVNSTEKGELEKASGELKASENISIDGQSAGLNTLAKQAGKSISISKSHSSSGSSSSSRSSSSSENKVKKKADIPNNESANLSAANQTSTAQLPTYSSATLPAPNDTSSTERLSKLPAGIHRNESPQIAVGQKEGDDYDSRSESIMINMDPVGMNADSNSQADNEDPYEAEHAGNDGKREKAEMPAKNEIPVTSATPSKAETNGMFDPPGKVGPQIKSGTNNNRDNQAEAMAKTEMQVVTEGTADTEISTKDKTPAKSAAEEGSTSAKVNERLESRSNKINDLAREKAEHNERASIERAQSYSSFEKERTEKSESAKKASLMALQRSTEKRALLPSATSSDSQRDEKSYAALGPAYAGSYPSAQEGKDAAILSKDSFSSHNPQRESKSSRSEKSDKIADLRADRTDAAAASKASAATQRTRDLLEQMKEKEKARETAILAAKAKRDREEQIKTGR